MKENALRRHYKQSGKATLRTSRSAPPGFCRPQRAPSDRVQRYTRGQRPSIMTVVLFENEDVVAIDKPEGLAAVPERRPDTESLFEKLCAERGEQLYIVHRIDKETSGVILFARNAEAHRWLNLQFEKRLVRKVYLALAHGVITDDWGAIDKPLRRFGSGRVGIDAQHGRASLTEFRILERFEAHSLVELYPRTGRRHQIRVHLYSIGHPVVGDPLYGDRATQSSYPRMMLHAHRLTFRLPSNSPITLEATVPESFEAVLRTLPGY
jgi:tRNA pseudouridine32 synthase/23S rRNA pseudouridine746 synthase